MSQVATHSIKYKVGTHRVCSPDETLAKVKPMMHQMGITRIADVTGLDTIGIPVVMVCRPNARSVSVSQGKGSTLDAAKASGLMESVEGFHAENIELPVRITTYQDLVNSVGEIKVVDPEQLPKIKESKFHKNYPVAWIASEELNSQSTMWLPYEMVHTNYTQPRPSGSGSFPASSNGLASGNNLIEATVHGICEVVERDAISLWHQLRPSELNQTSIDNQSIDSELCLQTIDKLDKAGQQTFIWDITSDTAIPTYLSVIIDRDSHTRHIGLGSGTHLSREVALLRALHEAVQVRTTYIVGARDDITLDEYTKEGIESKHEFFEDIIKLCQFEQSYRRSDDLDGKTVEEDLATVLQCLKNADINQVLQVDLTKAEFGVSVVRVVIPGLEAPHDEDNYLPGQRVRNLSERKQT